MVERLRHLLNTLEEWGLFCLLTQRTMCKRMFRLFYIRSAEERDQSLIFVAHPYCILLLCMNEQTSHFATYSYVFIF